jgi:hypothetical protein
MNSNVVFALLILGSAIFGGIARRWSGGLLSVWLGIDLGNIPVRLLWGLILVAILYVSGVKIE